MFINSKTCLAHKCQKPQKLNIVIRLHLTELLKPLIFHVFGIENQMLII